jgi:hypothetical protein
LLPFGRKDGLTRHHLAYTQGTDTPYEILEIETLNDQSVVVAHWTVQGKASSSPVKPFNSWS